MSWVWIALTIEVDNQFEAASSQRVGRHFRISFTMWANGLRFVDDEGVTFADLRSRCRAGCNLAGLERWGWISVGEVGRQRREGYGTRRGIEGDTVVRPTRAGAYARRLWPGVVSAVEERWGARFGGDVVALRSALDRPTSAMPWSLPEVAPPDGFRTRVVDPYDAAEGERPLVALLGQALTASTLDHERTAEVGLPLAANFLRVMGPAAVAVADLPALTGLSAEGTSMAVGFLRRHGLATSEPRRTVGLTAGGVAALDGYRHRVAEGDDEGRRSALEAVVVRRGALVEGLVPPEGCWRRAVPYLSQTRRLLADPTAALPWHPMVLHRGGWPDAS